MAEQGVNDGRRRFLTATTAVVGGVGAIYAAVPFVASFKPSARAQSAGAPVTIDISKLQEGQLLKIGSDVPQWRGQPIWIVKRSPEMVTELGSAEHRERLRDPDSEVVDQQPEYAKNEGRSIRQDVLVLVGICTHLGCSPLFEPEVKPQSFDPEWRGGFFCPCHGSKFDLSGRVYAGVPAPTNLKVPPYRFDDDKHVTVGLNPVEGAA
ncbi:MAG: ubiquinol-cytochrome c reductase iron-sulfur subunit [Xanthomonadaceae bacterium]|jgi:ubiquinol-cytochrome c reductase iron-sulfur subunit|nr:ubiquinol-cytochrome c reductase iron-sulfur subunit [Xanthomonadaceae bacterium]